MTSMKKALAAAAAGALLLTGCSSGGGDSGGSTSGSAGWSLPSTDPTATIKVVSILDLKTAHMQSVIDAFEKAHPTIKVDYQSVPFDNLNSTLDARIANKGGDPDVYWADQPRISALAARGEAEDLTKAFSADKSKFDPTAYDACIRTSSGRCRSRTPRSSSTTTRPC
jgi:multiple sugar transport system substrate-binding protein